ncbi:MAG: hypothetical protein J6L86_07690 [Alphaproteobacteria bacterium]|nr:hypothetical protein [Alphaproteobacteria bacterium]MDY4841370.1 hypothetical protein [Alphaproteobacteria bacterium]
MHKIPFHMALLSTLLCASVTMAQLPSNPWDPQSVSASEAQNAQMASESAAAGTTSQAYANSSTGAGTPSYDDILPVDPWARARVNNGTPTWRGSGRNDRGLNYIGEATTYGDAMGQEMIAPEVNRHNMLVMTEHLRKMGYKIPESYDQKIREMPQTYARYLRNAYDKSTSSNMNDDPLGALFSGVMSNVEEGTGLDFENILFNSIDILSKD